MKPSYDRTWRWVELGSTVCAVLEAGGGMIKTQCGQLAQCGAIRHSKADDVEKACPRCLAVLGRSLTRGDAKPEAKPKRPMPTTRRRGKRHLA